MADERNQEAVEAKELLIELVAKGIIFCPLSFGTALELFGQEYDSALRQAQLMEILSLNRTYRTRQEIVQEEIGKLLILFLQKRFDLPPVELDCTCLFASPLAYLTAKMMLDYPEDAPDDFVTEMTRLLIDEVRNLGLVRLVEMMKSQLPKDDWKRDFDPSIYAKILKKSSMASNGSKKKAQELERQNVLTSDVLPTLLKLVEQLEPRDRLRALERIEAFLSSLGNQAGEVLLSKLPVCKQTVEIFTLVGENYCRKMSPNDFVDIENMIVPAVYADVFVARDKWVKDIMSRESVKSSNQTKWLFSLGELLSFCKSTQLCENA